MVVRPFHNVGLKIHDTVRVAENTTVVGDVTLEENVNLWFGVIVRGDVAPILIGANTNIQDGCLLHDKAGIPTIIGRNVTAGHGAILHGCTVGNDCLIGMGAILLNGCVIGEGSIVAAGSLVTERTVFPPNSMIMGSPAKVVRKVSAEEKAYTVANSKKYVGLAKEELILLSGDNTWQGRFLRCYQTI